MTRERLYLFDTTLRDGAQTQGVDFNVQDKHAVVLAYEPCRLPGLSDIAIKAEITAGPV